MLFNSMLLLKRCLIFPHTSRIKTSMSKDSKECHNTSKHTEIASLSMPQGKWAHVQAMKNGFLKDTFVANSLLQMYRRCGNVENVCLLFDRIYCRNVFSWNIMMSAYIQQGSLNCVKTIFDAIPKPDVVSWSAIISAYSQHDCGESALLMFKKMQLEGPKPNKVTLISILDGLATLAGLAHGKWIHSFVLIHGLQTDTIILTSLVNIYGKCKCLEYANMTFNQMDRRNLVSWNVIVAAYAQHSCGEKAVQLFQEMQNVHMTANETTFTALLCACALQATSSRGRWVHSHILYSGLALDCFMGTELVNLYGKYGSLNDANLVFDRMRNQTVVSWNVLIMKYAEHGHQKQVMCLFNQMQLEGIMPDKVTFISVLNAILSSAILGEGKLIHTLLLTSGQKIDAVIGASLINMYGRCGSLKDSQSIFDKVIRRDIVLWNAIIAGHAQHGHVNGVLQLVQSMKLDGSLPDKLTLISILSVCILAELTSDGWGHFFSICSDQTVSPIVEHYNCLLHQLGQVGFLDEAEELINSMPLEPSVMSWISLLGACKVHVSVDQGRRAAKNALALDPRCNAAHTLLANIYATSRIW